MAIITASGRINIDLADVWAWLTDLEPAATEEEGLALKYVSESQNPGLLINGKNTDHLIDAVEFWIWVQSNHSPVDDSEGLTFGVPEVTSDGIIIDFTLDTSPDQPAARSGQGEKRLLLYTDEFIGEQNPGHQADLLTWELTFEDVITVLPALINDARVIHAHAPSPVSSARCALGTVKLYRNLDRHLLEGGFDPMTVSEFNRDCLLHCEQHTLLVRPDSSSKLHLAFAEKFAPYMECVTGLKAEQLIHAMIFGKPGDELDDLPKEWKGIVV